MSNQDQKDQYELMVFCEFAKVCPLRLMPETAQKRQPPEPDILCQHASGEQLAFELKQCEDVTTDGAHREKPVAIVLERLQDQIAFQNALHQAYCDALFGGRIDQPDRFKFHSVHVRLTDGFPSKNGRRKTANRVIKQLNKLGPGHHMIDDEVVRSIQCDSYAVPSSIEGPNFYVGSPCGARPYIVDRIKQTLAEKHYESDYRMHLLAWSTTATTSEFGGLQMDRKLANWLEPNGMAPFDRIWVFGLHEMSIVFDSAACASREKT